MSIMELKKNQKYKIEIVLGYNGKKKIRYFETFHGKKSEAKAREFELKKLLKNGSVFQKKNYTFKDLAQEYMVKSSKKELKLLSSERINYISKTTLEILKKWQQEQLKQKILLGSKWQGINRVFTSDYSTDIH